MTETINPREPLADRRHPMVVASTKLDPSTIVLTIDHDPRASYSRAVDPRAMREMRQNHARPGEVWELRDADYSQPSPMGDFSQGGTWGRAVYYFRRA